MAKYLVETYYTCSFKVNHYLDSIDEKELKNLEKRDDAKFEIIDDKLDNRKTKSLSSTDNKITENKKIEIISEGQKTTHKKHNEKRTPQIQPKTTPKSSQNHPKINPKSSQNHPKMIP